MRGNDSGKHYQIWFLVMHGCRRLYKFVQVLSVWIDCGFGIVALVVTLD